MNPARALQQHGYSHGPLKRWKTIFLFSTLKTSAFQLRKTTFNCLREEAIPHFFNVRHLAPLFAQCKVSLSMQDNRAIATSTGPVVVFPAKKKTIPAKRIITLLIRIFTVIPTLSLSLVWFKIKERRSLSQYCNLVN